LTSTATYNSTGVNFCMTFKLFNSVHLIFNANRITTVCDSTSECERSTHTSFTRTDNLYSDILVSTECSLTAVLMTILQVVLT